MDKSNIYHLLFKKLDIKNQETRKIVKQFRNYIIISSPILLIIGVIIGYFLL